MRLGHAITVAAWTTSIAAALAALAVIAVLPPRVNVRWTDAVTSVQREAAERELALTSGLHHGAGTWSYVLQDRSRTNIARLVAHPLVADTHYIDRDAFTLAVDDGGPAWARWLARIRLVQRLAPWLPAMAILLFPVGLASLVVLERRSAPRPRPVWTRATRGQLAALAACALAARVVLVMSGGQFYWPDESRYLQSRIMVAEIAEGRAATAVGHLANGEHPFFAIVGLAPAGLERVFGDDPRVPAVFFAIFGAFNVVLVALVAARAGASAGEAVLAAALMSVSTASLYYVRHLLPYDVAMTCGLLALYVAVRPGAGQWTPSLVCGVLAACTFLTYTGYWTLGGAALVVHVVRAPSSADLARRAAAGGFGLAATLVLSLIAVTASSGESPITAMTGFAGAVTQGSFAEGWRLPWEYLWHAEHGLLLLWVAGAAWCVVELRSGRISSSGRWSLVALAFVYVALAVSSTALEKFVVYGRLARQLVPLFCTASAAALWSLRPTDAWRAARVALALLIAIQVPFNFWPAYRLRFPEELHRAAQETQRTLSGGTVAELNVRHLYPGPERAAVPAHAVLVADAPHPLEFLPYQYEGHTPEQRAVLRSSDIHMRVYAVTGP